MQIPHNGHDIFSVLGHGAWPAHCKTCIPLPIFIFPLPHTRFQHTAFLALGSNLGDRFGYLINALRALNEHPQVRVVAASRIYETAPVGPVAQGAYLNACLQVQTDLCAIELLRAGLQIEAQNERVRTQRFGPRTLDIDLLAHSGTHHIETAELVLPHPRLHERAFVLMPLADIAPRLQIAQNSVADWLRKCPQSDIDDVRATVLLLPVVQGSQSNLLDESARSAPPAIAYPASSSPPPASPAAAPSASSSARLYHATVPCPLDPEAVFLQLQGQRGCVWLDSARSNPQGDARYSLVAANPISRLRFTGGRLEQIDYATAKDGLQPTETLTTLPQADPLTALEQWLALFGRKETQKPEQPDNPATVLAAAPVATDCAAAAALDFFAGGAVGYFSYEFGRQWERHNQLPAQTACLPQMDWALYDCAFIFDQLSKTGHIVACSLNSPEQALAKAQALASLLAAGLQKDQCNADTQATAPLHASADVAEDAKDIGNGQQSSTAKVDSLAGSETSTTKAEPLAGNKTAAPASVIKENDDACDSAKRRGAYVAAVEKVRDYIAAGDIYQVNIAQHFKAPLQESPADLYLRLRRLNPAPYAAYLDTGAFQILSSSPELFLQKKGRNLCTRPIKGTRPRGKNATEDARLCQELLASEKERAELLMIVDLERNDLGRVCEPGSVQVQSLYRIESYATVHHLVADVCGTLRAQTGLAELLRATFPGGSITGAPKVRAMEIIDELEQQERGIFCGAIGLIGLNGSLNLNIAIRTLLCSQQAEGGRQVHVSVGAGLVWDSDPQQEYEETLHKAEALLKAIHNQQPPLL